MRRLLLLALVVTVLVAGCSDDGSNVTSGDDGTTPDTTPDTTKAPPPVGGDATLLIEVTDAGGFVPAEYSFAQLPVVAIYSDGSVFRPGAQIEIYPPPALPSAQRSTVSQAGLDKLLAAADDYLSAGEKDFGQPGVTDLPSTTLNVYVEGKDTPKTATAYALSYEDGDGQLTPAQRDARAEFRELIGHITDPHTFTGEADNSELYTPTALSVLVRPADDVPPGEGEPQPNELDWPAGDLSVGGTDSDFGRCIGIDGTAVADVLAAAAKATAITRWNSADKQWLVTFRVALSGRNALRRPPISAPRAVRQSAAMRRASLLLLALALVGGVVPELSAHPVAHAGPPRIRNLRPMFGEVVGAGDVAIAAQVLADVAITSWELKVDGVDVPAQRDGTDPSHAAIVASPPPTLAAGDHIVELRVTGGDGRTAARAWRFTASNLPVRRLAGSSRVETAAEISRDGFPAGAGAGRGARPRRRLRRRAGGRRAGRGSRRTRAAHLA